MNTPPDSVFNVPRSSFMTPVPPPASEPDAGGLVCVQFNEDWLPYVLGCLWQLLQPTTWKSDDPAVVRLAQDRASNLIYLFTLADAEKCVADLPDVGGEMLDMAFTKFDEDKAHLDFEISPDVWVKLANLADVPAGTQPGGGSAQPQPGGGSISACVTLQASGVILLQAPMSTGDALFIDSADGAGNDGSVVEWWCPDGNQYFAGNCNAFTTLNGADPLPTVRHMSLIAMIGGTPYALYPGAALTIPGGVSNAIVTIQVNDSNLADNQGSYSVCYRQVNNTAATGTHTFDFTSASGGWIPLPDGGCGAPSAVWMAGVGWKGIAGVCTVSQNYLIIYRPLTSATILSVESFYQIAVNPATGGELIYYNASTTYGLLDGTIGVHDTLINNEIPSVTELRFVLADGGTSIVIDWTCTKIIVKYLGADPF